MKTKLSSLGHSTLCNSTLNVPAYVAPKLELPKFDKNVDDVDAYLDRFERFTSLNQWPHDEWAF